ncbi:MAG TPA: DUF1080 domain-containing protein [Verrucomicrobiae bacterium]
MRAALTYLILFAATVANPIAANFYNVTDPFMAEYEGFWSATNGAKGRLTAQIRPLANNQYDGFILLVRAKTPVTAFRLKPATEQNGTLKFSGDTVELPQGELLADNKLTCELRDGKIVGTFEGELGQGKFDASRSARKSPTLGQKPPKHAIILTQPDNTNAWQNLSWPLSKEGVLRVAKGNIAAKDKLTNFRLHVEFRTPYLPIQLGQDRGNSGVYLQGKYEVQVLDSFGLYPLQDNDCGGIYKVQSPFGNACLAPMEWQTYDITYVEGSANRPPRITVEHNGVRIIERAEVPAALIESGTGGGVQNSGFLMLQDHGNPVEFRNIWALPFFSAERTR